MTHGIPKIVLGSVLGAGLLLLAPATPGEAQATSEGPRTVVVEMVDFAFEPSEVVVRPGDLVRFVQESDSPHNVEFRETPDGTRLDDAAVPTTSATGATFADVPPPRMGPFITARGAAYEFVVGDYFAPGEHEIVCTPHEAMGMKGTLIVEPEAAPVGAGR